MDGLFNVVGVQNKTAASAGTFTMTPGTTGVYCTFTHTVIATCTVQGQVCVPHGACKLENVMFYGQNTLVTSDTNSVTFVLYGSDGATSTSSVVSGTTLVSKEITRPAITIEPWNGVGGDDGPGIMYWSITGLVYSTNTCTFNLPVFQFRLGGTYP